MKVKKIKNISSIYIGGEYFSFADGDIIEIDDKHLKDVEKSAYVERHIPTKAPSKKKVVGKDEPKPSSKSQGKEKA